MGFSWPVLGLYLPLPLPQHEISLKFLESVSGCSMCAEGRAGMSKSTVTLGNVANAPDKCPRGICLWVRTHLIGNVCTVKLLHSVILNSNNKLSSSRFAASSKVRVCGRLTAGIVGSNPAGGTDVSVLWGLVYFQLEVSATGRSLVQRSSTDGVFVSLIVIRCNINFLEGGQKKKERIS